MDLMVLRKAVPGILRLSISPVVERHLSESGFDRFASSGVARCSESFRSGLRRRRQKVQRQ
jgi:hypothetical protein